MTSRTITTAEDREAATKWLAAFPAPFTMSLQKGKQRSAEQNRLQRKWMAEASEQLQDMTAEEYRGYCKLHFGIGILKNESEEFAEAYDRLIRPRPYEEKLQMMMVPLDFSVTRLMTTRQKSQYLDAVYQHLRGLGVKLTEPGE